MGNVKTFMLGVFAAYGVYFITRKGANGRSLLDELLDRPKEFMEQTKDQLLRDAARTVKEIIK